MQRQIKYEGIGMGLSIVKKIVENHFGFVTAIGVPSKGATFEIIIPSP
jgi:signal transduction histidine kinase